jgi:hypothetical protein
MPPNINYFMLEIFRPMNVHSMCIDTGKGTLRPTWHCAGTVMHNGPSDKNFIIDTSDGFVFGPFCPRCVLQITQCAQDRRLRVYSLAQPSDDTLGVVFLER